MARRVKISSVLEALSRPSMAFLESLITTSIKGIMTGKLSIAISEVLLRAFEAMADTMVRHEAKPEGLPGLKK